TDQHGGQCCGGDPAAVRSGGDHLGTLLFLGAVHTSYRGSSSVADDTAPLSAAARAAPIAASTPATAITTTAVSPTVSGADGASGSISPGVHGAVVRKAAQAAGADTVSRGATRNTPACGAEGRSEHSR